MGQAEPQAREARPKNREAAHAYFAERGAPAEADAFLDHFESNGWRVGGRADMRDWKAAARTWIANAARFARRPGPAGDRAARPAIRLGDLQAPVTAPVMREACDALGLDESDFYAKGRDWRGEPLFKLTPEAYAARTSGSAGVLA